VQLTKRRFLLAGGTTAVGGIALTTTSSTVGASVSFGELSIPRVEHRQQDTIKDVILAVDAEYKYTTDYAPTEWRLTLNVGPDTDSLNPIGTVEKTEDLGTDVSDSTQIQGSLPSAPDYELQDFQPVDGGEKSVFVVGELLFELYDGDEVVASANVVDSFEVVISNESVTVESVGVGGKGGVTVVEETPTSS